MNHLRLFARFWYDFIVGDSVALAIGGCAITAIGALLVWLGIGGWAELVMPMLVAVTLAVSLRWPR